MGIASPGNARSRHGSYTLPKAATIIGVPVRPIKVVVGCGHPVSWRGHGFPAAPRICATHLPALVEKPVSLSGDGEYRLTGWMRSRRASWVVGLAIAALALNALVPIHLAIDLSEAYGAAYCDAGSAARHGLERRLLALVIGHDAGDGKPDGDHHHPPCPALAALGALTGFAAAAAPALPAPVVVAVLPASPLPAGEPHSSPAAAYRSRAPPLG
jgi:hypothetical protein